MSQARKTVVGEHAERFDDKKKTAADRSIIHEHIYADIALNAIRQAIRDVETLAGYRARHKRSSDRIRGVARELKELAKVLSLHRYHSL